MSQADDGLGDDAFPTLAPTFSPTQSNNLTPTASPEDDIKAIIFIICGVVIVILLIVIVALLFVIWKYGKSNGRFESFDITSPEFAHIISQSQDAAGSSFNSVPSSENNQFHASVPSSSHNQFGNNNHSLQMSQVYNSQNNAIVSNNYQDSITFNSVQNHSIQQIIQQNQYEEEQMMNASLGTDLPSSGDESSSASSFTVDDPNHDVVEKLTRTASGKGGKTQMHTVGSESDNENETQTETKTAKETTKGLQLPKPKTKGGWM